MTPIRYQPRFWPEELDAREAEWEAPDALCVAAVEREAANPQWALWQIALSLLGWLWVIAAGLALVAGMSAAFGEEYKPAWTSVVPYGAPVASTFRIITIKPDKGPLITFHADGRIEVSPDAKPDEAAKAVIEAMRPYLIGLCK